MILNTAIGMTLNENIQSPFQNKCLVYSNMIFWKFVADISQSSLTYLFVMQSRWALEKSRTTTGLLVFEKEKIKIFRFSTIQEPTPGMESKNNVNKNNLYYVDYLFKHKPYKPIKKRHLSIITWKIIKWKITTWQYQTAQKNDFNNLAKWERNWVFLFWHSKHFKPREKKLWMKREWSK